ncbi:hypothetical protein [Spiroplasma sp. SV19]|uniref:hypothetical protein n=1 Tax=Spiroplasma sp. SV19 TaxID=2570468 RepID=UPI0024B84D05|nr:hypothetical protein [Spiroplasma sp. SV19]WHQ36657.1 hypothetical protein E7Y35_01885 [Spiroplasma sp. SV19]
MANLRIELGNYTVKIYHRNKCLFNNPNLIIYDLDTGYYLWMGNLAKEQMNGTLNIVKTRLLERDKLVNLESLLIYLNNLELDFVENQFFLVHNFTCTENERLVIKTNFPNLKWITIKQHYGLMLRSNHFYVDVKTRKTIIYQRSTKDVFKLDYGLINLQESVQFYLARTFNVMLDPTELIAIIPQLCQEKWASYQLQGISLTREAFEDIILTDYHQVMHGFLQLKQKIKAVTKGASIVGNSNYDLLANI